MADLIDRDALLKEAEIAPMYAVDAMVCYDLIKSAPAVNRWIPVEDALPDNGVAVLVYTGENNFKVWLAEYSKYMEVWTLAGNYVPIKKNYVSHWMPLPEPPENGAMP